MTVSEKSLRIAQAFKDAAGAYYDYKLQENDSLLVLADLDRKLTAWGDKFGAMCWEESLNPTEGQALLDSLP